MEVTLTEENFAAEVLQAGVPVLVDFSATWCGPCQMLAPVLSRVAARRGDTLKVGKVDVDQAPGLAAQYGISSIPALLLFVNGRVVGTSVGFLGERDLEAFVDAQGA